MIEKNETESLDTYIYNILSRLVLLCGKPWTTVTPSLSFVVSWHWSAYSRISSWSFSFSSVPCNPTLDFKLFREISKYVLPDFEHDKWTMLKNCNIGAGRLPDGKIKFNAFFSIGTLSLFIMALQSALTLMVSLGVVFILQYEMVWTKSKRIAVFPQETIL